MKNRNPMARAFRVGGVAFTIVVSWWAVTAVAQPTDLDLTVAKAGPGEIEVRWNDASPGLVYSVQSRPALANDIGIWLTRSDQRPWPVSGVSWTDNLSGQPTQFYRVLALPATERGRILSVSESTTVTIPEIELLLELADIPVAPEYAVDIRKVVYETLDPWGGRTQASGAMVLPVDTALPLSLLSYQHGTLVLTNDVPSAMTEQILPGVGFASLGYAVAMPDLLGLGDSPGLHPYHHARSEATAGVDMLRAVRTWCETNDIALNGQLFLIGYSHGGHATMALHREIESFHADEFVVTASAPMAGAHDLSETTAGDLLSGRSMPNPYYLVYLLAAYQEVYRFSDQLADLLAAPYDSTLPPLLNGTNSGDAINLAMPSDARLILKPSLLAGFESDGQHPLRLALRDNDLIHWTPMAPVRLYHCRADQDVIFANSEVALASFHARGALQVQLIDPEPTADHGGCTLPAFLLAKDWFESLRE
jgi:hypothetical protein